MAIFVDSRVWVLFAAALIVSGCSRAAQPPVKTIRSPAGGNPVLTASERAERDIPREPAVSLASFEQPLAAPRPPSLKPIGQWTEEETAADALSRIGAPAVPLLIQTLQRPDAEVRLKAIAILGRMGSGAKEAVPELVRLLNDPNEQIRKAAALTLGRIGPAAAEAAPALVQSLFAETAQP